MLRQFYLALFAFSLLLAIFATHDEIRGTVTIYSRHSLPQTYSRVDSPGAFRQAMNYEWFRAFCFALGGYVLRGLVRRQDSLDPFSPTFEGKQAIDELGEELDRRIAEKKEAEKNAAKKQMR